ncbi:hypothetical protein EDC44_102125 [Cricetibacter osteomyelitidis]|uniref:Uncharacterized protein n=1 Tax=Cricetibacter osteomyelitidis TaxID=1521931 RepID=A0A4R2T6Q3_9PAST|nr:hypothetical protein EDC44_102125 [Cricetibacter osteomyelitidis]
MQKTKIALFITTVMLGNMTFLAYAEENTTQHRIT